MNNSDFSFKFIVDFNKKGFEIKKSDETESDELILKATEKITKEFLNSKKLPNSDRIATEQLPNSDKIKILFDKFLEFKKITKEIRPNTQKNYIVFYKQLLKFISENDNINIINNNLIENLTKTLKKQDLNNNTINKFLKSLKGFLEYCYKNNFIEKLPNIELLKSQNITKLNYNLTEIDLILNSETIPLFYKNVYKITLYTGLRINEIHKLQPQNIEIINNIKVINFSNNKNSQLESEKLKNKNAYRIIPIHSEILDILNENFINELHKISYNYFNICCNKYLKLLINNNNKTFHSLRATFVENLTNTKDINIIFLKRIIGHSQGENDLTINVYAKNISIENLKETIELLKYGSV